RPRPAWLRDPATGLPYPFDPYPVYPLGRIGSGLIIPWCSRLPELIYGARVAGATANRNASKRSGRNGGKRTVLHEIFRHRENFPLQIDTHGGAFPEDLVDLEEIEHPETAHLGTEEDRR